MKERIEWIESLHSVTGLEKVPFDSTLLLDNPKQDVGWGDIYMLGGLCVLRLSLRELSRPFSSQLNQQAGGRKAL